MNKEQIEKVEHDLHLDEGHVLISQDLAGCAHCSGLLVVQTEAVLHDPVALMHLYEEGMRMRMCMCTRAYCTRACACTCTCA